MNKKYITVDIPILDNVEAMKVVETFTEEQLWYVCAIAKALEEKEKEFNKLKYKVNKLTNKLIDYKKTKETRNIKSLWIEVDEFLYMLIKN